MDDMKNTIQNQKRKRFAIDINHLSKRYGNHVALDDISFSVSAGEVVGLIGPNGAGKTTAMNIMTGYISSTTGEVHIDEINILEEPESIKRKIGYLPENPPLYPEMTVNEYLYFVGSIRKVPRRDKKDRINRILEMVGLSDVHNRLLGNLSKGYKQRVGLAQALMGNPDILILDEPTSGLDPKQNIEMRGLIKELGREHTVILSSHILPEVSEICSRIIIIDKGRIVVDGNPTLIGNKLSDVSRIIITAAADKEISSGIISEIPGISSINTLPSVEVGTTVLLVESKPGYDLRRDIFNAFCDSKIPLIELRPKTATLEKIFMELTNPEREI